MPLSYIYTGFENASPLDWEVEADGTVRIGLLYDHERNSPNRAAGHWHFQLHTEKPDLNPDSKLRLILENFEKRRDYRRTEKEGLEQAKSTYYLAFLLIIYL